MKITIATDAWHPQINGVVTTLGQTRDELQRKGHNVLMLTPEGRRTIPMPTYPEIRLTLFASRALRHEIEEFEPDCVHIATEGPIGLVVRKHCISNGIPFTTAYHTQFPEYVRSRIPVPISWTAALLRWFHKPATRTMVPTSGMRDTLLERGFQDVVIWSRGVQTDVFTTANPHQYLLPDPIWVYVGRVAVEKNITAFLRLKINGSKIIIGDGPDREKLSIAYPDCHFLGYKFGEELASHLAGADVFVFPSKTDTFGIVMLEAMACGLPVAAFPVTGPIDVVDHGITGYLDEDLSAACNQAIRLDPVQCRAHAESRSWSRATDEFISNLAPVT